MQSVAVLLCFLFLTTLAGAQDVQSWNEIDLAASWRNVDFLIPFVARVDSRLPNPQLTAAGITADLKLLWHLTLTGGYLLADLPQTSQFVHLPLLAVTKSFHPGRLTVSDRNRVEKLVGFGASPVRYRNRLMIDRAFGATNSWHIFANDEAFFDLSASTWEQNRFQAGAGTRFTRRLFLDCYYLERSTSGRAPETHVVGATLKVLLTSR